MASYSIIYIFTLLTIFICFQYLSSQHFFLLFLKLLSPCVPPHYWDLRQYPVHGAWQDRQYRSRHNYTIRIYIIFFSQKCLENLKCIWISTHSSRSQSLLNGTNYSENSFYFPGSYPFLLSSLFFSHCLLLCYYD